MKSKLRFSVLIVLIGWQILWAGSTLYLPVNFKSAYEKGTRSYDGSPGPNYWQNHADYQIEVKFDPALRLITGHEKIRYYNQSPDSLDRLVIRLYQDLLKKGGARDWQVDPTDLHNGVQIKNLRVNGKLIELEENSAVRRYATNLIVYLKEKLAPQSSIDLSLDWEVPIARHSNIRMGTYDSTSFHVAYWYPQIAVYDDIDGWDQYNYTGLQEFYNDFNNYDVRIKVPQNFIVWATGRLQNVKEVLQKTYQKRYQKALRSDSVIHVITEKDLQNGQITANNTWNTFHYKAHSVPDFAFALSDHYLWDLTSVKVPGKKERVLVGAAYKKESEDFYEVAAVARKAITFFSETMPAFPFPYPSLTVFNGKGGMEFPMMVNDGSAATRSGMVHVTSHEIAHTYFPFMMGTNERKYAWMDEGWATMLPFDFQAQEAAGYDPIQRTVKRYLRVAGTEFDIPMIVPSIVYGGNSRGAYRNASYNRSGMAYYLLEQLLGREKFLKALHVYMTRWQGKHPIPFDFFFTFNSVLGENLNWFFRPWFFEFGYPDLALETVSENEQSVMVRVVKKGQLPIPVKLTVLYEDSSHFTLKKSLRIWQDGKTKFEVLIPKTKPVIEIKLGDEHIPDLVLENNVLHFSNGVETDNKKK